MALIYSRLIRGLVAVLLGLSISSILLTGKTFLTEYRASNGTVFQNGKPIGGDFICFYAAGVIYNTAPKLLYSIDKQMAVQREIRQSGDERSNYLRFVYPPLAATFFSVFSQFPLATAYSLWCLFSLILFSFSLLFVFKIFSPPLSVRLSTVLLALGFSPFLMENIAGGQLAAVGLFLATAVFTAISSGYIFLAGVVLSLSYYKPPLFVVLLLLLILTQPRRLVFGFLLGAFLLLTGTYWSVGLNGIASFIEAGAGYLYWDEVYPGVVHYPKKGSGLWAMLQTLFPKFRLDIYLLLIAAAVTLGWRKRLLAPEEGDRHKFHYDYALTLSLSVFLSLQAVAYDLSIVLAAIIIVALTALERSDRSALLLVLLSAGAFNLLLLVDEAKSYEGNVYLGGPLLLLWLVLLTALSLRRRKVLLPQSS